MTRKKRDFTRDILPDPKYGDHTMAKAVNALMVSGKKGVAERALYGALEVLKNKVGGDPLGTFHKAINNIKPQVEVRSRRVGGATYQVPTEVRGNRAQALALRWLMDAASKRGERGITNKLAAEMMDALNGRGAAAKKREDTHKMADANKAFAHYRF